MKLIKDFGAGVKLYRNPEFNEYVVKVAGNKDATYYTDDKDDAHATAQYMRNNQPQG